MCPFGMQQDVGKPCHRRRAEDQPSEGDEREHDQPGEKGLETARRLPVPAQADELVACDQDAIIEAPDHVC